MALDLFFQGNAEDWLVNHIKLCHAMATSLKKSELLRSPSQRELEQIFLDNIVRQGGSAEKSKELIERTGAAHTFEILAPKDGFLWINLSKLKLILKEKQESQKGGGHSFPDPCGLILRRNSGDHIRRGDLLATARIEVPDPKSVIRQLESVFLVNDYANMQTLGNSVLTRSDTEDVKS